MKPVLLLAHEITTPLEKHRRSEFSKRVIYLSKYFKNFILISTDKALKKTTVKLEFDEPNKIYIYRIPSNRIIATLQITRIIKNLRPRLVICDSTSDAPITLLSKILFNFPLAVFSIAFDTNLFLYSPKLQIFRNSKLGTLIKRLRHLIDFFVFNLSDKIIYKSPAMFTYINQFLIQKDSKKLKFIPNSYSYIKNIPQKFKIEIEQKLEAIFEQFDKKQVIITYAGILTYNKRPDIAISTLKDLLNEIDNAVLLIIGNGPMKGYLRNLGKKLEIDDRIFFLGELKQYETIAMLSESDVVINPSVSEGFSNVIAEAMTVGIPVVAYAQKSLKVLCREKGAVLIYSEDPKEYAIAIYNILTNSDLREKIIRDSLEIINPLVSFTVEKRFSNILEELIDSMKRSARKNSPLMIIRLFFNWIKYFLKLSVSKL